MAQFPAPAEGIAITHFIVSRDVERSRRFYVEVLGGEAVLEGELSIVALANGWITISVGGGPTDDKPTVTLEPPSDPSRVSSFLNIRVADIGAMYQLWSARGAKFLTPPINRGSEIRCYMRDPDDRQHVMLTMRLDPDVPHHDEVVVALHISKGTRQDLVRNALVTCEKFIIGIHHTGRSIGQPLTGGIIARPSN